jgi:hypothetical protein
MTSRDIENWRKVKHALEAAGKTDCHFYQRAIAILQGKPDPMDDQRLSKL